MPDDVPMEDVSVPNPPPEPTAETTPAPTPAPQPQPTVPANVPTASPADAPPGAVQAAQTSVESPQRGFQTTLNSEIQDLARQTQTSTAHDTAATNTCSQPTATATTAVNQSPDREMADAPTVARDNATGPLVHIFVNQPVTTPVPANPNGPTTYAAAAARPAASIPARRSRTPTVNPYLRPLRLNPARHVTARYEIRVNVPPSSHPTG